jgi:hypothetical protein
MKAKARVKIADRKLPVSKYLELVGKVLKRMDERLDDIETELAGLRVRSKVRLYMLKEVSDPDVRDFNKEGSTMRIDG